MREAREEEGGEDHEVGEERKDETRSGREIARERLGGEHGGEGR